VDKIWLDEFHGLRGQALLVGEITAGVTYDALGASCNLKVADADREAAGMPVTSTQAESRRTEFAIPPLGSTWPPKKGSHPIWLWRVILPKPPGEHQTPAGTKHIICDVFAVFSPIRTPQPEEGGKYERGKGLACRGAELRLILPIYVSAFRTGRRSSRSAFR
jgi:hypothetical protein